MNRWLRIALLLGITAIATSIWTRDGTETHGNATSIQEPGSPGPASNPEGTEATHFPREAFDTLAAIRSGGPFPYDRDGGVFQNRERRLPQQRPGYYREYTVETPGARDRGARRIVAGGDPPDEFFYTDDHYGTFRRMEAADGG